MGGSVVVPSTSIPTVLTTGPGSSSNGGGRGEGLSPSPVHLSAASNQPPIVPKPQSHQDLPRIPSPTTLLTTSNLKSSSQSLSSPPALDQPSAPPGAGGEGGGV